MGLLTKIETFLDGKKTYIIALLTGGLGIFMATGHVVPEWVWTILGAAGLGAVRSAIGNSTNTTTLTK
jgi:hypothetical protein